MGFIRVKGHGRHRYAYLVSEKWTENGPRQSVSEYLGKVFEISRVSEPDFSSIKNSGSFTEILSEVVGKELLACGFSEEGRGIYRREQEGFLLTVEVCDEKVRVLARRGNGRQRDCVFKMNDGFFCEHSTGELFGIIKNSERISEEDGFNSEPELGRKLAALVVNAGLKIPPEVFVSLYEALASLAGNKKNEED